MRDGRKVLWCSACQLRKDSTPITKRRLPEAVRITTSTRFDCTTDSCTATERKARETPDCQQMEVSKLGGGVEKVEPIHMSVSLHVLDFWQPALKPLTQHDKMLTSLRSHKTLSGAGYTPWIRPKPRLPWLQASMPPCTPLDP